MSKELSSVDITGSNPAEVVRRLREVVASGRRAVLTEGEEPVASVLPTKPARKHQAGPRQRPDPIQSLANLVGLGTGPDGATDVSANKYKYLAEAYANLHDTEE